MSHNTGNFVHELVIMAKAFEELPQVREELNRVNNQLIETLEQVQRLELKLIDRANEIDTIRATLAGVEAERDEATRAFLEADDKIAGFTRLIKDQAKAFGLLLEAVEPKAEPEPVNEPTVQAEPTTQPTGQHWSAEDEANHQRAVDPTPVTADGGDGTSASGQSEAGPIAIISMQEETTSAPLSATSNGAEPIEPVSTQPSEGVSVPADPTANSTAGDGASSETATPTLSADAQADAPEDDVGYHNEPLISTEPGGWQAWDSWCTRMNRRYGGGSWPARPATA